MRINKAVGSKDRLVEIFQKVNHVKLNENLMEMGGASLNPESVLGVAFDQLKNKRLRIEHSNTQATGNESYVEISATDPQGNSITFTFKANSSEGDQEGVFNVNSVTLHSFTFDSADGEDSIELAEDGLKRFNQQHANDMMSAVQEYLDVEPQGVASQETSNSAELQEAIDYIDSIKKDSSPYGGGFDKMQTGKNYADRKPTNDKVRVSSPELDKFIQEEIGQMNKPIAGMTLGGIVEDDYEDDDQEVTLDNLEGEPEGEENMPQQPEEVPTIDDELPVDNEPAPEVSPEKRDRILQAYENLIQRVGRGNPNYSPTTPEVMAELDRMSGVQKPRNTRTVSKEAVPYLAEEEEKKKEDSYSPFKQLGKTFKPKSQSKYPKKKKKPQTSVKIAEGQEGRDKYEDIVFMQGDEAYQPLEILDREGPDAALKYLEQWHYPGEHQTSQTLGQGSDDKVYEKDGYTMTWNPRLGYIGLKYDLSKVAHAMDEDNENDTDELQAPNPSGEKAIADVPVPSPGDGKSQVEIDNPDLYPDGWKEMDGMFMGPDSPGYGTGGDADTAVDFSPEKNAEMDAMNSEPESDEIDQLANDKEQQGELIPGGKGEGKSPTEFSPDQILMGMKVEMKHTDDPMYALEITIDHLTEDPEYYTSKETPEDSAQANASADAGGEAGGEDKEMTDLLLGFKPHNVGDEVEGGEEEPEAEETPAEEPKEVPVEEPEAEEEPEEKKAIPEALYESQIRTAKKTLTYSQVPTGMSKKEAVQLLIKHMIK